MSETPSPADWLRKSGAQRDVVDGLARFESWAALWRDCPRGDWLLGIAERLGVDHVALVRAAIGCARVALAEREDAADGATAALLDVAERWTRGEATTDAVDEATKAAEVALNAAVDPAGEARARAALAVGLGVGDRAVLPGAAAAAAESVILATIDCGFELALRWAHDKCAAEVRAAVPWSLAEPCLDRRAGAE